MAVKIPAKRFLRTIIFEFREFFFHPNTALNLAIFRVSIFSVLLIALRPKRLDIYLSMAPSFRVTPPGMSLLSFLTEFSSDTSHVLCWILRFFCVCAIAGLFTRVSTLVTLLLSLLMFSIGSLFGRVVHDTQSIIWFAMLLSVSPCGDAFSIDELIRKWRKKNLKLEPRAESVAYGMPIRFAWFLIGIIFFFPGVHKLFYGGLDWVFSDNLANILYSRWYWDGAVPPGIIRIDKIPYFTQLAAGTVVIFEIAFIFALFHRKLRWVFVVGAECFHAMNSFYLQFPFLALRASYVVFPNWSWLLRQTKVFSEPVGSKKPSLSHRPVLFMGVFLVLINSYLGVFEIYSWPFTSYPTFRGLVLDHHMDNVQIELIDKHGIQIPSMDAQKKLIKKIHILPWQVRIKHTLLDKKPALAKNDLLKIHAELAAIDSSLRCATLINCYQTENSIVPEEWSKNPLSKRLIYSVSLEVPEDCVQKQKNAN